MSSPFGGSLGTAYGKVRIDYESNSTKAVKDIEAVENTLVSAGKSAQGAAKQISHAQTQINTSVSAAAKALEKGVKVSAPITISPKNVSLDTGAITKAIGQYKNIQKQAIIVNAPLKVVASKVEIDKASISRSIESYARQTSNAYKLTVKSAIVLQPTDVSLDQRAIDAAVRSTSLGRIEITAPVTINPSDVSINQSAFQNVNAQISGQMQQAGQHGGNAAAGAAIGALSKGMLLRAAPIAAAGAAIGFVFSKGFSRLQGLDQAAVKLKALRLSTEEIQSVADSSLKSVKGTAFGLDEAFQTAATAINSGIKPGQQLDQYLTAVASTAALANTSMIDLGDGFSQAAVAGKLTGDVVERLRSQGVPYLQALAKEYNVSQKAAADMVSNGEVDFQRFIHAMAENSDAAKIMSNTVGGSFKNLLASISRISAMLLAPLFGTATGEASNFAKMIQWVTTQTVKLEGVLDRNKNTIIDMWVFAAKAALTWGHVTIDAIGWVLEGLGKVIEGVGHVPSAFAGIADFFGKHGLANDLRGISDGATDIGNSVFGAGQKMFGAHKWIDQAWSGLDKLAEAAKNAKKSTGELGDVAKASAVALKDALGALDIKPDAAEKGITGTVEQFKELLKTLKEKKAPQDMIDTITRLRSQFDNGGRQVKSFADAIDQFKDSTIDADSRAQNFIKSLQGLGQLPDDSGLIKYNEDVNNAIGYQANLVDALDKTGNALVLQGGQIDVNSKNGQTLSKTISQLVTDSTALVAAGKATPDEAFAHTNDVLKNLLAQFGITGAAADEVVAKYFPKDAFTKAIQEADPRKAVEDIFANDPAKIQSELVLLDSTDDILSKLLGPDGVLHVPMVMDPSAQPAGGTPGGGGPLIQGPGIGPNSKDLPPEGIVVPGVAPPGMEVRRFPNGSVIPVPIGGAQAKPSNPLAGASASGSGTGSAPFKWTDPFRGVRDFFNKGQASSTTTQLEPTSLLDKSDEQIKALLDQNQEIKDVLAIRVSAAEAQGQSLSEAFAEGINSSSPEVRDAIIRLAALAADGLGSSPAKYGPLSGRGWTLYRGKTFTKAWGEGIESEKGSAATSVSSMAGAATLPLDDQVDRLVGDLQQFSDFGKSILDFASQLSDIAFTGLNLANTMSGGKLFPKSYVNDPLVDRRRGTSLPDFNPKGGPVPSIAGPFTPGGATSSTQPKTQTSSAAAPIAPNAKGDDVARRIISEGQRRGWNEEQILAALGIANQETGFGTNPRTNAVQNQNGTAGITGVFQQDMSYRKYGDPRDPNNAINGFMTEFENRGMGLKDPNPWHHAVSDVQIPAPAGAGGYNDATGKYLENLQRGNAVDVFNRLGGRGPAPTPTQTQTSSLTTTSPIDLSKTKLRPGEGVSAGLEPAAAQVAALLSNMFPGITDIGGRQDRTGPQMHPQGRALDVMTGENAALGDAIAAFVEKNYASLGIQSRIWRDKGLNLVANEGGGPGTTYTAGGHGGPSGTQAGSHVHIQFAKGAAIAPGALPAALQGLTSAATPGGATGLPVTLPTNTNQALIATADNTSNLPLMPQAISNLAANDPDLSKAIAASQTGIGQDEAVPLLQHLDGLIADQNKLGTPDGKKMADALGNTRSQLMQQTGLKEGPDMLGTAQSIASGVSGLASSIFEAFDAGLKSVAATKDLGDIAVRGIENTESINKIIDNVQVYIDFAAKIGSAVTQGLQLAADIAGAAQAAGGGPMGGDAGGAAVGALQTAAGIAGIVTQVIQAVNTAIDIGQEAYKIGTKYLGRALTTFLGFPGASDIHYLLDTVTGQLNAYTSDNPLMKHQFNTISRELRNNQGGVRPAPNNSFVIYQGPGQDPRDTMDDAMFTIRSSGVGAFGYAV
jgi:tape measure domain-containing protein